MSFWTSSCEKKRCKIHSLTKNCWCHTLWLSSAEVLATTKAGIFYCKKYLPTLPPPTFFWNLDICQTRKREERVCHFILPPDVSARISVQEGKQMEGSQLTYSLTLLSFLIRSKETWAARPPAGSLTSRPRPRRTLTSSWTRWGVLEPFICTRISITGQRQLPLFWQVYSTTALLYEIHLTSLDRPRRPSYIRRAYRDWIVLRNLVWSSSVTRVPFMSRCSSRLGLGIRLS